MAIDSINSNATNTSPLKAEENFVAPRTKVNSEKVENKNIPDLQTKNFIEEQKSIRENLEQFSYPTSTQETKEKNSFEKFISKNLIPWTTGSSALINFLSAPVHLFNDDNPLKKIINHISMFFTKVHQITYSLSGMMTAHRNKNPLLLFSFFTEGVAALLKLRNIYLFRGIATGIDGIAAGIVDKHKKCDFSSYSESWKHSYQTFKETFSDFGTKFAKDPLHIFKLSGNDIAIFASALAAVGGGFGMTINEKIGGAIRDVFGTFGDYGIFKLDNPIAKSAGFFYLGGSILDLAARVFNKGIANMLGVNNPSAFEKLRDAFHECSIAFDRFGQFFFLRYNEQNTENLQNQTREDHQGYLKSFKTKTNERQIPLELARERNFASAA